MLRGERNICEGFRLIKKEEICKGVDQICNLINMILQSPNSRYQIVTSWDPTVIQLKECALPSCHHIFGTCVRDGKYLDLIINQRSVDTILGLPFNIASYAFLIHILGAITGYKPGILTWVGWSTHIYENQIEGALEQLKREPRELPTLEWNRDDENTSEFINTVQENFDNGNISYSSEELTKLFALLSSNSFKLNNYNPHPTIKIPLSTGLNKPEITTTFEELKLVMIYQNVLMDIVWVLNTWQLMVIIQVRHCIMLVMLLQNTDVPEVLLMPIYIWRNHLKILDNG